MASLRKQIRLALEKGTAFEVLDQFPDDSPSKIISVLFPCLCSTKPVVKWNAVEAMGIMVTKVAQKDMESARIVMRKLLWNLGEESGTLGLGMPEAMGEILSRHQALALEYHAILVSFIREDGNYLEFAPLQAGALWGIGRAAQTRGSMIKEQEAQKYISLLLTSPDDEVRLQAKWALKQLADSDSVLNDPEPEKSLKVHVKQGETFMTRQTAAAL